MISKIQKKFRKIFKDPFRNFEINNAILFQTKELEWAHIYHDSIRGKEWLEKLPLNVISPIVTEEFKTRLFGVPFTIVTPLYIDGIPLGVQLPLLVHD